MRCLRRVNRTGLAGAVIEGWLASSADFVAVIDGDLQHDESILPQMYAALERGEGNLAIGTRVEDADAARRAVAGAQAPQRSRQVVFRPDRRVRRLRSHERLLHDQARNRGRAGAEAVAGRLQDFGRRRADGAQRVEGGRGPLRVPSAHGGRIETLAAWSGSISSASSPITPAAACCRHDFALFAMIGGVGLVVHSRSC